MTSPRPGAADHPQRNGADVPAMATFGVAPTVPGSDGAEVTVERRPGVVDAAGAIPTGLLAVAADHALGGAIAQSIGDDEVMITSHLHFEVVGALTPDVPALVATGEVVEKGGGHAFTRGAVRTPDGRLLALMSARFAMLPLTASAGGYVQGGSSAPGTDPSSGSGSPASADARRTASALASTEVGASADAPAPGPALDAGAPALDAGADADADGGDGGDVSRDAVVVSPDASPVLRLLGMREVDRAPDRIEAVLSAHDGLANERRGVHGGAGVLMAERVLDQLVATVDGTGRFRPVELRAVFLRPIPADGSEVTCEARIGYAGRSVITSQSTLYTPGGKPAVVVDVIHAVDRS